LKYACDSISRGASITTLIECECILIDIGFIGRWKKEIDILEMAKRSKTRIRTWCHERTVSFPYFAHTYPVKYV